MENKLVIVNLREYEGKDVLEFVLNEENIIAIDLNNKDQTGLRKLFYAIINKAIHESFEFDLHIENGYNKNLYIDISKEYIKQLNSELAKIVENVPEELKGECN